MTISASRSDESVRKSREDQSVGKSLSCPRATAKMSTNGYIEGIAALERRSDNTAEEWKMQDQQPRLQI